MFTSVLSQCKALVPSSATIIRRLLWVLVAALSAAAQADPSAVQRFTQAHMLEGRQLDINTSAPSIALPHSWNQERPQRQGIATYLIEFSLKPDQKQTPIGIYMPRIGNRFELYVNDELIHASGALDNMKQFASHKAAVARVPKSVVLVGLNSLKMVVAGEAGRYAGLSSVSIGDYETLTQLYDDRQLFQSFTSLAIVIICVFIAFITILYSYLSNNKYALLFGLGSLAWALNNGYLLLNSFPFNYRIALFFYDFFYAAGLTFIFLTVAHIVRLRYKWYETLVYGYLYFSFFTLVIYHDGYPIARTLFLDGSLLLGSFSFILYFKTMLYRRERLASVVFMALLAILALAIYDQLYIYRHRDGFEMITYSRYSFILFVVAIATSLASQFLKINAFVQKSHSRMGVKLKIVKSNLSEAYAKRSQVEKKLTLQQERLRLMQDMHDGLGHRLIGLQQAVQDPVHTGAELNQMVKQTIAELRTTIQSINQSHDNVSYMLGDLRERLEFLCVQYKKQLHWSVDEMPTLPFIDELKVANIEKILLEIFTNIAKHSQATQVSLSATFVPNDAVTIVVKENGAGFANIHRETDNPSKPLGLLGIQRRALEIQAALMFEENGKTIRLIIPSH